MAGKTDDVVHGQEVAFVLELDDHRQLVFHLRAHLVADALGPAPAHTLLGQFTQPAARRLPCRHQFARVFVAQLAQIKLAAPGYGLRLLEQRWRIQLGQRRQGSQVALPVGEQPMAGLGHAGVMADGREGILQRTATAGMHVHVAHRYSRQTQAQRLGLPMQQALGIFSAAVQADPQPQPLAKQSLQPQAMGIGLVGRRQPDGQQAAQVSGLEVFAQRAVFALGRPAPRQSDQPAQRLIALQVFDQQHQLGAVFKVNFTAGNQRQLHRLGRLPGAHDAGQRALVGDRQGTVTVLPSALEQLASTRGPPLKTEVAQAVQLGIRHGGCDRLLRYRRGLWQHLPPGPGTAMQGDDVHPNHPCSHHCCGADTGRYTQAHWPSGVCRRK